MPRNFSAGTGRAGRNIVLYECTESWPSVFASDKFQGPVLCEMPGEGMIVLIPENSESEVIRVWYKDMYNHLDGESRQCQWTIVSWGVRRWTGGWKPQDRRRVRRGCHYGGSLGQTEH